MASSGSVDFNLTQNEIVADALIHLGAIEQGESPSAAESTFATRQLNRMVKTWQADGVRLWTRRECILFTAKSQGRYTLGPGSSDHAAELTDVANTELSAAAVSGASTIDVDSVTGIAVSDNIGVVLDDDTIDWDTVASISSLTITLTGTLSGAAGVDKQVFAYTTLLDRPLRIIAAQRLSESEVDTPITMISHNEYQRLPNKTSVGLTNEAYYQPTIPTGSFDLWPEPETAADRIRMTCQLPIEDFDATSNNPDFPQEWLDALTWGLAKRLLPSYGTPARTAAMIMGEAAETYELMNGWDVEPESTFFEPAFDGSG